MMRFFLLSALLLFGSGLRADTVLNALLTEARATLAAAQPEKALTLLQAEELAFAGTPEFDYWLGVAAVRAGNPSLAVMALDRLILVQPNHAGGRMERGMALLQLGMLDEADQAFAQLEQMNPPEQAAKTLTRYRTAIAERRLQATRPSHSFMLGGGYGYDSNVNTAPADYLLELFGGLFQARISDESSAFQELRGHYFGHIPLDKDNSLQLALAAQSRSYTLDAVESYNLALLQGQVNWRHSYSPDLLVDSHIELTRLASGKPYSGLLNQLQLQTGVQLPVFLESRLSLNTRWRGLVYDESDRNNLQALVLEGQLTTPLDSRWRLRSGLLLEQEWAENDRDGGDALRVKAMTGLDLQLNTNQLLRFDLSYQQLDYRNRGFALYNDFKPASRDDYSLEAAAAWNWMPAKQWLVTTRASYRKQNSSLDFFDYDQFTVSSSLAYTWR